MSRKYKQRGYQDDGGGRRDGRRRAPRPRQERDGPRSPRMTAFQEVFRCAMCGATQPIAVTEINASTTCENCSGDLHSCKNCVFFDPASPFECTQPIKARIYPKDKGNLCEFFEPRTRVEKETTSAPQSVTRSSESSPSVDPRDAFERLFKR